MISIYYNYKNLSSYIITIYSVHIVKHMIDKYLNTMRTGVY